MKNPDTLRAEARAWLDAAPDPTPRFNLEIGWATSYTDLFAEKVSATSSSMILPRAMATGRVVLTGPGGSGKTVALRRVMREALDGGALVAWVDFTGWSAAAYERWKQLASPSDRISFLIRAHAKPTMSLLDLDSAPRDMKRLIFVDGLNEITAEVGQDVLLAIDDYVQTFPQSSAIVSDRLVRRSFLRADQWHLGRVLPLTKDEVAKYAPHLPEHLRLAFFLDTHIRQRGDDFETYFSKHCGLNEEEIETAAEAAYKAYERRRSRVFELAAFEVDAGQAAMRKLVDAGSIKRRDPHAYFEHHLMHDFLVARFLAGQSQRWTSTTLDIATFNGSSVDVLPIVARRISGDDIDRFIRRIYDWNFYAAGYVLAEANSQIPEPLQVSVLGMLAERRFDRILSTAERASDALLRVSTNLARELASAQSLDELLQIVARLRFDDRKFTEWKRIFVLPVGSAAPEPLIANLDEEDSILGWAASNVLKRTTLTSRQEALIRDRLASRTPMVVRWRSVHALGGFPNKKNLDALLQSLAHDSERWVRYGAQRSVVELAASAPAELRTRAFERLHSIAMEKDDRLTGDFVRTLLVRDPPADWPAVSLPVLIALREREKSEERREDIERVAYEIRRTHGVSD